MSHFCEGILYRKTAMDEQGVGVRKARQLKPPQPSQWRAYMGEEGGCRLSLRWSQPGCAWWWARFSVIICFITTDWLSYFIHEKSLAYFCFKISKHWQPSGLVKVLHKPIQFGNLIIYRICKTILPEGLQLLLDVFTGTSGM